MVISMLYQANPSAWNTSFMMYACGVLSSLTLLGTLIVVRWLACDENLYRSKAPTLLINKFVYGLTLIVFSTLKVPFAIASYGFMQWANPSLGILLRGNAAAVIMNNRVPMGLKPLDRGTVEKYLLQWFVKNIRCIQYLQVV